MIQLFTDQDADGNSVSRFISGGTIVMASDGNDGGGTLTLQINPDGDEDAEGDTWVDTTATLTAAGTASIVLPSCRMRLNLASSTGASLNAWLGRCPET